MNFLQRLADRLRAAWAALRGLETGVAAPLPPGLIDTGTPTARLVAEAAARGGADARAYLLDNWSFGTGDEPLSDVFDPSYVLELRHRRETAVQTIRDRQVRTAGRVAHLRRWRQETDDSMRAAREMMAGLAVREARREQLVIQRSAAADGVAIERQDLPVVAPDDQVWEGEANPLGAFWRALLVVGLIAAEFPVEYFGYEFLLDGRVNGLLIPLTLSTSVLMVLGPYLAGLLLRGRQATGAERRVGPATVALAAPWIFAVVVLGLLRGAVLNGDRVRAEQLHLTPTTVVLMFVGLQLVVGVMAFMLGLARRHPFQEAYVRQRLRRDRFDTLLRRMAERINPAYRQSDEPGVPSTEEEERAVRSSYAAAEEAYFAALASAVGDPTFTEAIQQRRGLRVPAPDGADPRPAGGDPSRAGTAPAPAGGDAPRAGAAPAPAGGDAPRAGAEVP